MRRRTDVRIHMGLLSADGQPMFLLQAIYKDEESWHKSARRVSDELDSRDGGFNLLGGRLWWVSS